MSSSATSWKRRLAQALARHAVRVMPSALAQWARAIGNELAYLTDDRAALRWALGGVGAAYRIRLSHLWLLDIGAIRVAGVLLMLFRAFDVMLPSMMTTAYRLHGDVLTDRLGRMTPGDDYHRLIPLMNAIPAYLHAMLVTAGTCYIVAALCLLARRRTASVLVLAAVVIEFSSQVFSEPILAATGVVVTTNRSVLVAILLPIAFPLLLAGAAWSGSRRGSDLRRD
jgi:hypothetical protein